MKRRRLNANEKRALASVDYLPLFDDPRRRLRNALLVIVKNDPRWMSWVEEKFPQRLDDLRAEHLKLIEQRAREIVLAGYSHLPIRQNDRMIFNDHGVLVQT